MAQRFGYFVDLATVQLSDDGPTWIQAMPIGKYKHPFFGDIEITDKRVKRFSDNVNNNVRGTELDIDYEHKMHSGEAAGWVKAADARPVGGLFLLVDWTAKARQLIRDKAYRYFSPEFSDEWVHPKTNVKYKDVIFGGGITNRPFLKDIAPINASELVLGDQEPNTGGRMDPKQLRKALRLPEDASDEQVSQTVDQLAQANEGAGPPGGTGPASDQQQQQNPPNDSNAQGNAGVDNGGTNANQTNQQLSELAAKNPLIKQLMEQQAEMRRQLAEQQARIRLSDMSVKVTQLNEKAGKKGVAFPAIVLNELPKLLTDMSDTVGASVLTLCEKLLDTRLVQLGELGHQGNSGDNNSEGQDGLHKAIVALMDKDKQLAYAEAMDKVLSDRPELFDSYRASSYAGRE